MIKLPLETGNDAGRGGPNRLFLFITIGLVGMLVLGILGIAGWAIIKKTRTAQVAQMPTETPTEAGGVVVEITPTPTLTMTPTPRPTNTPTRAPTFTPVVIPTVGTPVVAKKSPAAGATTVAMATTPTPTFTPAVVSERGATPQTGLSLGGVVGIGLLLAALTVAARRLRSTG
jgi:cytoskeletal protein RodZ